MAYSYVQYTGNGSIKTFSVPFTYISKSHVTVKVNGVVKSAGTDYNWDTDSSITFVTAPGNGLTVDIRRASSPSQRLIDFQDGSTLTQDILDADSNQNFFMAQEAIDAVASNIALDTDGVFNANNKRIKNVADPVNPQDVATKNWAETSGSSYVAQATTQANNAATSAGAAATSASAAAASATSASGSAGTASSKATDASNSATAAAASAAAALTSKNSAATSETNAASSATTATTKASDANTSAVNAATSASSASASASTATTKASDASASATSASNSASAAATSATNSASSASSAAASATTAGTSATNASNSATAAAGSASSAASSATTATTKASDAAASASSAATSATTAGTSATNAANSATAAATSASNAATSATNAASSYNTFRNQYQGAYATAPTTRPDSSALQVGDLYFNTTTNSMQVRGSSGWTNAGSSVNGTSRRYRYIATAGQTTFSGSDSNGNTMAYDAGYIDVYLNGVRLDQADYTASSGTSLVLSSAAAVGEELNIIAFGTFNVSNFDGSGLNNNTVSINKLTSDAQYMGFKNRIINSAMMIDQRNAGASVTNGAGDTFTVDRWKLSCGAANKLTAQQNAASVTSAVGFKNYLGITSTSAYSIGSGDYFVLQQAVEGLNSSDLAWGTANAATVTLSFWIRSSLTGTFGGAIRNSDSSRNYPFTYTVSSANTWEQKTITIAGDTSGTWLTTNGIGIAVGFGLGVGSTYSGTAGAWTSSVVFSATGATSVVGTNGATFYITGVQLEKGSTATSFDYRPYGTELALCQRYFYKAVPAVGNGVYGFGYVVASDYGQVGIQFPVLMRSSPTLSYSGSFLAQQYNLNGTPTSLSLQVASAIHASVQYNGSSGGVAGVGLKLLDGSSGSSSISFNSEL